MSDLAFRVALVGLALLIAFAAVSIWRRRSRSPHRTLKKTGLEPGVYFFTSSSCADCGAVRKRLASRFGDDGFVEFSWESDRKVLERLDIGVVPSSLVVAGTGAGTLWAGAPDEMFSVVDP